MSARVRSLKQTESAFQRQVLELAKLSGWRTAHFRPGLTQRGTWVTAVAGDGKGFLDLVLVRERLIFAELKSDVGKLTPEQEAWIARLQAARQETYVWRPKDWSTIMEVLK